MTRPAARNIAASIRQRLLNKARESGRPFSELLQYFAIERFLYRLTKSEHADKFILKGALMLAAWQAPLLRPTMDIDVLGRTANDMETILTIVKDICAVAVQPEDGLIFNAANVQGERIAEAAEYEGVRVRFRATLDAARLTMQLDIGFGDVWCWRRSRRLTRQSSTCLLPTFWATAERAPLRRSSRQWSSSGNWCWGSSGTENTVRPPCVKLLRTTDAAAPRQ